MTVTSGIPLQPLLAACFSAANLAGQVIREVVRTHADLVLVNKATDFFDPQTIADRRSQQRIAHALRARWPQLVIVGEEGELGEVAAKDAVQADVTLLPDPDSDPDSDTTGSKFPEEPLDPEELVVWIDPLDGTKQFTAHQLEEVGVLVGISYKHRPIAGVVHLPFHGEHGTTYWGGLHIGIWCSLQDASASASAATYQHQRLEKPSVVYPQRELCISSPRSDLPRVHHVLEQMTTQPVYYGGATGAMALRVVLGKSDVYYRFRNNTKRWDICAVEALITALGGSICDRYGRLYDYDPNLHDTGFDNVDGVLVTLEPSVQRAILEKKDQLDGTK